MVPYRYPANRMPLHSCRQENIQTRSGKARSGKTEFAKLVQQQVDTLRQHQPADEPDGKNRMQKLGKITRSVPTVSDLLIRHPEYKKDCWNIVYARENIDKPYTQIPEGTDIYIDPVTRELMWGDAIAPQGQPSMTSGAEDSGFFEPAVSTPPADAVSFPLSSGKAFPSAGNPADVFTDDLVDVVRSFIGTPYQKMDCYEMVVEGLQGMGVRYHGKGGLAEHLKDMATREGRYRYAYFNGEGLLQASGADVFSRTIPSVKNHDAETKSLMEEIAPILKKGMLLSFSTTTRGHTGIISQKDSDWTFINSGWMDHEIENRPRRKAVGEENLNAEIRNWLQRAARQKEPLQITLGRLDEDALNSFRMRQASLPGSSLSRKI
jgi:hypothetical protein